MFSTQGGSWEVLIPYISAEPFTVIDWLVLLSPPYTYTVLGLLRRIWLLLQAKADLRAALTCAYLSMQNVATRELLATPA